MKILLTLATTQKVKAGVEVYGDHLKKIFPDLKIIDCTFLPSRKEPLSMLKNPIYARRLDKWFMEKVSEYSPEIIFTNGMDGWHLSVDCPVVNIQHGTFAAFAQAALKKTSLNYWRTRYVYAHYEKMSAKRAKKVVANSPFTKNNLQKYYRQESIVIPNAIDTEVIKPVKKEKARERLNFPQKKRIVIFVGRPDYTKGFDIVESVAKESPETLFVCVFPFPHSSSLKNISTFSNIDHSTLPAFYSAADICMNPSRFEGFGYVPLEALACNTPVIGNATGIFATERIEGFTEVENTPLSYRREIDRVKPVQSRPEIVKTFSFEKFKNQYVQLIKEL